MNKYTIVKNSFLSRDITAYYRCDYKGYGNPGNPDYINTLKNTFDKTPAYEIQEARELLASNLVNELSYIVSKVCDTEIAICIIPRAKMISSYSLQQLSFALTIKEAISLINVSGKNITNGSDFIIRHTDTRTTHLQHTNLQNNGDLPYRGITNDTCTIADQVRGKHILLVDDIYTKNVNVDEDAIQCLLEHGAEDVTFFSIARTPHKSFY